MKTLNVIGCGRVGQTLARLWQQQGLYAVQDLHARSIASAAQAAQFIGSGRPVADLAGMRPADVWMLTVPDAQVAAIAAELAQVVPATDPAGTADTMATQPIAFHCSGFLAAAVLEPLRERGWKIASAHPMLNFASPETGVRQFAGTPCGLEGDGLAVTVLISALTEVGGECFTVSSEFKPLYHAGAVFSSNFMVVLQGIACDAWRAAGVPDRMLPRLNAALLQSTVTNVVNLGPAQALTGPAARGDSAVIEAQGEIVAKWNPLAGEAYRTLSLLARRLAQSGTSSQQDT